ncbi:hypothetical protein XBLMG947_1359 [Xanthomonas bromi]|uniref:Uncharacterized protein n=1 Tax=Xanthomonas bromi TaxID=56449 RepID=A0A1C3NJJ6_9XANT|nr:hypothetical protein [Xanthomonas bromi]PPV07346.1 hypothetical protein XbrCFBP1976_08170 [Xanthomonas bromi]SBV50579.1 hypothetical protein XBLMG947_1359 [Xanthomonas bromi]
MPPLSRACERLLFIASMLVMTASRVHHASDWLHLPGASMAVFCLDGLALRRYGYFVALLGVSVAIDCVAVSLAGVSDFCITAADAALPVAYGLLWYAGRASHARGRPGAASLSIAWGLGTLAAVLSFLISNGAFYWWGGRYTDPHGPQYLQRAWQWGPLFVRTTAPYLATGLTATWCVLRWRDARVATPASVPLDLS